MSGLIRGMIDQVLKNMGEGERKESVNYVTDRMVERMNNEERTDLLMMILDRVMSNLSAEEKANLATRVTTRLQGESGEAKADVDLGQPSIPDPSA
jgi:hypothetical protein